jgi:chromosome segregation ATPase
MEKQLNLRESRGGPSSSANTNSQRLVNRKLVDEALREAEEYRCKTAQLNRVWKHNSELLQQERQQRQKAEKQVLERQATVDSQVKDIHEVVQVMRVELESLFREGDRLEENIETYQEFCQIKLREVELLQFRLDDAAARKAAVLQSSEDNVAEMRLKVEKLESMSQHMDNEIKSAEADRKKLNLELRLGGI